MLTLVKGGVKEELDFCFLCVFFNMENMKILEIVFLVCHQLGFFLVGFIFKKYAFFYSMYFFEYKKSCRVVLHTINIEAFAFDRISRKVPGAVTHC